MDSPFPQGRPVDRCTEPSRALVGKGWTGPRGGPLTHSITLPYTFAATVMILSCSSRPLRIRSFGCCCLIVVSLGCEEQSSTTLEFAAREVDLGTIDGTAPLIHDFPFDVAAPGGVKIIDLQSSCECTSAASTELSRRLAAGDKGSIHVEVSHQGAYGGIVEGTVSVVTEPPSKVPIVLTVRALSRGTPAPIAPSPQRVRALLGTTLRFPVDLVLHRPSKDAPLAPDLSRSDFGGLKFERHELFMADSPPQGAQIEKAIRETHRFTLSWSPVEGVSEIKDAVNIVWHRLSKSTRVDLLLEVHHPLDVLPSAPFLGIMKPRERRQLKVAFRHPVSHTVRIAPESSSTTGDADAHVRHETAEIIIDVMAPSESGRFVRSWALTDSESSLPPLRFSVAGIVRDDD